jgi:hypothetical protein
MKSAALHVAGSTHYRIVDDVFLQRLQQAIGVMVVMVVVTVMIVCEKVPSTPHL